MKIRYKKSFGLLETVFAVAIFATFAASIITVIMLSSKNMVVSKHRLQAANLAREGIELTTEIRDSLWKRSNDWLLMGFPQCWNIANSDIPKRLEFPTVVAGICENPQWNLIEDAAGENITQNNVTFNRKIYITRGMNDDVKNVRVVVEWDDNGETRNVTMVTLLTNWK